MGNSDIITLQKKEYEPNEYGVYDYTTSSRDVFCDVNDITQREFFKAGQLGLNPQYKFTLSNFEDYKGEKTVVYRGQAYSVYRTFRNGDKIELYVIEKVGVENG